MSVDVFVSTRDAKSTSGLYNFGPANARAFRRFWSACCERFAHHPDARIVVMLRRDTPMADPGTGQRFRRTSVLMIQDGDVLPFSKQEAKAVITGETRLACDLPDSCPSF